MTFMNFYDIGVYVNKLNANLFSSREVAEYSFDYYEEYNRSIENGTPTKTMINLCGLLNTNIPHSYDVDFAVNHSLLELMEITLNNAIDFIA